MERPLRSLDFLGLSNRFFKTIIEHFVCRLSEYFSSLLFFASFAAHRLICEFQHYVLLASCFKLLILNLQKAVLTSCFVFHDLMKCIYYAVLMSVQPSTSWFSAIFSLLCDVI